MGGFFKKVAGAFVYMEEPAKPGEKKLEDVTRETVELLQEVGFAPPPPASESAPILSRTADQVFAAAGFLDGPNSAQRVLKIIAGLSMFPREQQVVMVRAMDAADDSWSEGEVQADARRRQSALRTHLQAVEAERTQQLQSIAARVSKAEADAKRRLDEIDSQIAELQKMRGEAVGIRTQALAELELEQKNTEESAEKARRGITGVINALSELITFFGGDRPT